LLCNVTLHIIVIYLNFKFIFMEKCKKVVSNVKQVGEPDQYGNNAFSITFADNTSGFFKCKEQDLFFVGQEAEFYISQEVGRTGKEYSKIHRVSSVENQFDNPQKKNQSDGGGHTKSETSDMINRSVAVKAACELLAGSSNNTPDRVLECAELFFDYIQFGITDKQPANVAAAVKEINELPWN